jgi:predicted flap endonuclease-1-like 5' DNA nuclease
MSPQPKARPHSIRPRNWQLEQLPGLSAEDRLHLETCGITTTGQLLQKASTPTSRQALANQLQLPVKHINKWVALSDLARVPGVGYQHCGLLLHSGIVSVNQLAQIPAHKLQQQILRLQVATLQRRDLCPSVDEVQAWIQQAQQLVKS